MGGLLYKKYVIRAPRVPRDVVDFMGGIFLFLSALYSRNLDERETNERCCAHHRRERGLSFLSFLFSFFIKTLRTLCSRVMRHIFHRKLYTSTDFTSKARSSAVRRVRPDVSPLRNEITCRAAVTHYLVYSFDAISTLLY